MYGMSDFSELKECLGGCLLKTLENFRKRHVKLLVNVI